MRIVVALGVAVYCLCCAGCCGRYVSSTDYFRTATSCCDCRCCRSCCGCCGCCHKHSHCHKSRCCHACTGSVVVTQRGEVPLTHELIPQNQPRLYGYAPPIRVRSANEMYPPNPLYQPVPRIFIREGPAPVDLTTPQGRAAYESYVLREISRLDGQMAQINSSAYAKNGAGMSAFDSGIRSYNMNKKLLDNELGELRSADTEDEAWQPHVKIHLLLEDVRRDVRQTADAVDQITVPDRTSSP